MLVVLVLCMVSVGLHGQRGETPSAQSVAGVLRTLGDLWDIPELIDRLASELDAGLGSRSEKRARLEDRLAQVFAPPELEQRLRVVREGSIDHTWSDGFSDLTGTAWSPPRVAVLTHDNARVVAKRLVTRHVTLFTVADIESLFGTFPLANLLQQDLVRQLNAVAWRELTVLVVARMNADIDMVRTEDGWRVAAIKFVPDLAYGVVVQ
jgi:hypothetical protein